MKTALDTANAQAEKPLLERMGILYIEALVMFYLNVGTAWVDSFFCPLVFVNTSEPGPRRIQVGGGAITGHMAREEQTGNLQSSVRE